jgi:phage-related protein
MNRLAVVLAADSATTVTEWTEKGREDRYFKGANKIFQLSDHHPVGLMIFDSADIMRVPWETVVKTFRNQLKEKSFNSLQEYALEFFAFLEAEARLFPAEVQKTIFLENARSAAINVTVRTDDDTASLEKMIAESDGLIKKRRDALKNKPFAPKLTEELYTDIITRWSDDLVEMLENWRQSFERLFPSNLAAFAELGMLEVFKDPATHFGTTGLVFAGFGNHDIFPAFANYKSCGLVCGNHVSLEDKKKAITHEIPAWLESFAQTAMSDTFALGVSEDVYKSMMQALNDGLKSFAEKIAKASGGELAKIKDFEDVMAEARKGMGQSVLERARKDHAMPLRRVLSVLPVDEMAELAETLINLQSLKEKVTKRSESVGGPIDVAIITKSEGLVWVKRKHYFDIDLNSRYLARLNARLS